MVEREVFIMWKEKKEKHCRLNNNACFVKKEKKKEALQIDQSAIRPFMTSSINGRMAYGRMVERDTLSFCFKKKEKHFRLTSRPFDHS